MGRLIQTDYAVGTPFAVSRYYSYTVSPLLNQILITSPNNLQQKTIFDSAGRMLMHFNQLIATTGKPVPGRWFPVHKISYDHYGRIFAEHTYTVQKPDIKHEFTTTQDYDDSSRIIRTHLPDNREMITAYDDADRCMVHYEKSSSGEYSAISVVHANILYQPVMKLLLPTLHKPPYTAYHLCHLSADIIKNWKIKVFATAYDAFGREVMSIDPLGHVVKMIYNSLGAATDIIDPKGNKIHNVYDLSGHRIQSWAYPVIGGHYLLSAAEYNSAGKLLWNAGEDGRRSTFNYNENGQLLSATNPAGHTIYVQYNRSGLPVAKWLDGKLQLQLQYDLVTRLVKEKEDITGKTTFIYDADGLIRQLIHLGDNGYSDYKLKWEYDINRRITASVDIAGNQTRIVYDMHGRVKKIIYHSLTSKAETVATLVYDDFSRIKILYYGSGMDRYLSYDDFGHLMKMRDTLYKCCLYSESFYYDANDNITTLMQKTDQVKYARLNYHYDALNNLMSMTCKGSDDLHLCPRDTDFSNSSLIQAPVITRQDYNFTPLNRLASVREILQDLSTRKTVEKVMNYHYSDRRTPLRLQLIDTTWNHQEAVSHHFYYDFMGNMTTDGKENHLLYNAFNQIVQVTKTDGQQSYYSYDSSGKTVKTVSAEGIRYLFYQGSQLINEKINSPQQSTHLVGYLGTVKTIDGIIQQYNETNYKGDVVGILKKTDNTSHQYQLDQRNVYSPYGMAFHYKTSSLHLPLHQKTLYGFDGELTDPATGWQFLGNGHRTYNPVMRYFVSEDPVGGGYGFGSNNPIMNSEPSGNTPHWLGSMFKWFGDITSFGLNALHSKWANIASTVIMAGLAIVTLGASAATYGGSAFGAAVAGCATISGSIPVIAASIPANKGLNMVAAVIGLTEMAVTLTTVAADIGFFLSRPFSLASDYTTNFEMANPQMLKVLPRKERVTLMHMNNKQSIQLLKESAPNYLILEPAGEERLIFHGFADVANAWKILKSKPNDLIVCDTAALLLVAQKNEKPLYISDLMQFLEKKKAHTISLITRVYDKKISKDYAIFFSYLLDKLSDSEGLLMQPTPYSPYSIKDVLLKPGKIAVIYHMEHVGVVARNYENTWSIYDFYRNGTVKIVNGSYEKISNAFFPMFLKIARNMA